MKALLKEKDLSGRNGFWYMAQNSVHRVLDTRIIDRIISDYWKSDVDVTGTIMEASTSYRIIKLDDISYVKDYERGSRFYKQRMTSTFKSHPF
jgi:hypothetical protein